MVARSFHVRWLRVIISRFKGTLWWSFLLLLTEHHPGAYVNITTFLMSLSSCFVSCYLLSTLSHPLVFFFFGLPKVGLPFSFLSSFNLERISARKKKFLFEEIGSELERKIIVWVFFTIGSQIKANRTRCYSFRQICGFPTSISFLSFSLFFESTFRLLSRVKTIQE